MVWLTIANSFLIVMRDVQGLIYKADLAQYGSRFKSNGKRPFTHQAKD
jgi:hypothetical protein